MQLRCVWQLAQLSSPWRAGCPWRSSQSGSASWKPALRRPSAAKPDWTWQLWQNDCVWWQLEQSIVRLHAAEAWLARKSAA
jgi:hypothetical protein